MKCFGSLVLLLALNTTAMGASWEAAVEVGVDTRWFWQDPAFAGQGRGLEPSLYLEPEWRWRSEDRRHRLSVVAFARADEQDHERHHVDLRELYWAYEASDWDLLLGVNKVFWGVTESRHLVDVINQTDVLEDLDQEDKLGQPMLNINWQRDWGRVAFYLLPGFRPRSFAGVDGRLRAPLPVAGPAQYESAAGRRHVDLALRYSHYFGDVDFGIHAFQGTNREARLIPSVDATALIPVYDQMSQLGVDLQWTRDAWLWKLEAVARRTPSDTFTATVAGFEYTFYQAIGNTDIGVLTELLYDGRDHSEAATAFDNDIFAGFRFGLNDIHDSSVLAGAGVDIDSHEVFINFEAQRRLAEHLLAEVQVRVFSGAGVGDPGFALAQDDYLQLRLSWHY